MVTPNLHGLGDAPLTRGRSPSLGILALTFALAGSPSSAHAQALRPYVGGAFGSFSVNADEVDGRSAASGLVAGISITDWADAELEWVIPTSVFVRSRTARLVSFAPPGASRDEIERLAVVSQIDHRHDVTSNVSAVVIFRAPLRYRVRVGVLAGVTNQRATMSTAIVPVSIPEGVNPLNPNVVAREERTTRNFGAITFGGNVSIALTRHLDVVPDVRYDYGSIGDEIHNALRTSVRVLWRF
jgi:hypothetical protein